MKKLIIKRTFDTPIDKIWDSFTIPELLRKWWSPEGMTSSHVSVDLKKDGLFRYCFKGMDGSEFWGRGIYQNISKPTHISYLDTFTDSMGNPVPPSHFGLPGDKIIESLVDFAFLEHENKTKMTITGDNYFDDSMSEDMTKGWNSMFDKLHSLL